MPTFNKYRFKLWGLLPILAISLASCFTGIESTKKIQLTRSDIKASGPSPEQALMTSVSPIPLSGWKKGMEFVVIDPKIAILFSPTYSPDSLPEGSILRFGGISASAMPDGSDYARISWILPNQNSAFQNSGKKIEDALQSLYSDRLPMVVDRRMVSRTDSLLRGLSVWNKSRIAYSPSGERITALRFTEFKIDSVTPGSGFFPLKVWSSFAGSPIYFYMDFNSTAAESRPFEAIFSLEDPKLKYPSLPQGHWEAIREGRVVAGMTKDECLLSLGSPSDVNAGRDYSSTIDLWQYPDGTFLRFSDGILVSFRK